MPGVFIHDTKAYGQADTPVPTLPDAIDTLGAQRVTLQAIPTQATRETFEQLHHTTSATAQGILFLDAPSPLLFVVAEWRPPLLAFLDGPPVLEFYGKLAS